MNDSIASAALTQTAVRDAGFFDRLARQALLSRLRKLREGRVTLIDGPDATELGTGGAQDLDATLTVHDPSFYRDVALGGGLGAAKSYIDGRWTCDDLTALIRIFVRNMDLADGMERGLAKLTLPLTKLRHWLRSNTRSGSSRNIKAHYDLGDDFFELMLDDTMTYSCGIFERPESTLRDASIAKLDRVCRKLELSPSDHVVEIGTGWGGFAIRAAGRYGCRVTTTTISPTQRDTAVRRIAEAGLADRVTVLLQDYRDLRGRYDKLVSIEMIEAVGDRFLDAFFGKCSELLEPHGMMLLQAITMSDQRYDQYLRAVDFIQRYVFPGCCVPSQTRMCESIARATDLRLSHLEDIGPHYARTLREWRIRLHARLDEARAQGRSEELLRLWDYYLCYCEAGFEERYTGDVQMLLTKPRCRREPILADLTSRDGERSA